MPAFKSAMGIVMQYQLVFRPVPLLLAAQIASRTNGSDILWLSIILSGSSRCIHQSRSGRSLLLQIFSLDEAYW
jgi:hypothetical protein